MGDKMEIRVKWLSVSWLAINVAVFVAIILCLVRPGSTCTHQTTPVAAPAVVSNSVSQAEFMQFQYNVINTFSNVSVRLLFNESAILTLKSMLDETKADLAKLNVTNKPVESRKRK